MSAPNSPRNADCNCCYGLWKPSWGRDRITPGDTARSWYFTNPLHFAILRFALALMGSVFLIYSAATDKPPPPPDGPTTFAHGWFAYWKFYSYWTLALCVIYCFVASLLSYTLWKQDSDPVRRQRALSRAASWESDIRVARAHVEPVPLEEAVADEVASGAQRSTGTIRLEDLGSMAESQSNLRLGGLPHHRRISRAELCQWLLYETVWAASIFCASTFWVFIGLGCLTRKGCSAVNPNFWVAQVFALGFIAIEIFFNKLPYIPLHSILTLLYCVLWLIFSTILYWTTGQWFYPRNQSHGQLYSAITFWPGWIFLNVVAFFFGMALEWVIARIFPLKHSPPAGYTITFSRSRRSRGRSRASNNEELGIETDTSL